MDPAKETRYIQMAAANPHMLCSEAPLEVLQEAVSDGEPTRFLEEFFATGYTQWRKERYGALAPVSKLQINNAIVVLWLRAGRLHTSVLLGQQDQDPDWSRPFFSDEGLYGD